MPLNGKNISKGSYNFQQDSQGLYNFRMDSRGPNLPDLEGQIALATLYASFFSSQNNHGNDRRNYRTKVGKYNKLKRAREGKLLNKNEVAETSRISQLKSKTTDSSKTTTTDTDVLSSHKIKYPSGYEEPKLQRRDIRLDLRNPNPISTGSAVIRSGVSTPSMGSKDKVFKASRQILSQDDLSQNLDKDLSIVSSQTIWSEGQSKPVVVAESFKTRQSGAVSCQNGETASSVLQSFIISQGVTQLAKIFYLSYNSQKIEFFEGRAATSSYNLDFSKPSSDILIALRSLNPSYDAVTNSYIFTKGNLKYQFSIINRSFNGTAQEYVYNTVYDTSNNLLCSNLISVPNLPSNTTSYSSTTSVTVFPTTSSEVIKTTTTHGIIFSNTTTPYLTTSQSYPVSSTPTSSTPTSSTPQGLTTTTTSLISSTPYPTNQSTTYPVSTTPYVYYNCSLSEDKKSYLFSVNSVNFLTITPNSNKKFDFNIYKGKIQTSYQIDLNNIDDLSSYDDGFLSDFSFSNSTLKFKFQDVNFELLGHENFPLVSAYIDKSSTPLCSERVTAVAKTTSTPLITTTPLPVTNFSNSSLILYDNYSCAVSNNSLTLKNNGNISYSFERVLDSRGEIAGLNLTNHKSGLSEFLNISNGTLTSSNGAVTALSLVDGVYKLPLKEERVILDYNTRRNTYDLKTKDGQEIVSCSNITLVKPNTYQNTFSNSSFYSSSAPFLSITPSPNPILSDSKTYCSDGNIWVTDFKNGTTYNFEANTSAVSLADVNKKIKEFCEQSSEKNFFNYMVENVKNFSNFFGSEKKDCYIDPKDITPNNIKTLSKLLGDVLNKTDGTQNIEKINNLISHVKKIENITNSSHFEQDQSVCKSSDDNDNGVKILPIVLPIVAAILIGVAAKSIRQLYKSGVAQLNRR